MYEYLYFSHSNRAKLKVLCWLMLFMFSLLFEGGLLWIWLRAGLESSGLGEGGVREGNTGQRCILGQDVVGEKSSLCLSIFTPLEVPFNGVSVCGLSAQPETGSSSHPLNVSQSYSLNSVQQHYTVLTEQTNKLQVMCICQSHVNLTRLTSRDALATDASGCGR